MKYWKQGDNVSKMKSIAKFPLPALAAVENKAGTPSESHQLFLLNVLASSLVGIIQLQRAPFDLGLVNPIFLISCSYLIFQTCQPASHGPARDLVCELMSLARLRELRGGDVIQCGITSSASDL